MQKISSSTTTANGAGEFTQGQPGSGVDATMITVAWLNAIQRELVNLVVGSGQTLTPTDDGQVLKAVKMLQELASTWDKVTGKPTTRDGYKLSDVFTKSETGTAIQNAVAALVASSPAALDTLKELADALGNDPNFATTILNALGLKADKATSLLIGSTSRQRPVLAGTVAAGSDGGSDGKGGAIEIREINEVGGGQTDLLWAPSILFNWSGKFARYLKMSVLGDLIWGDKKIWTEGNFNPASKANTVDVTNALALKANTADVLASAAMTANGRLVIPTSSGVLYIQWYEGPLAGAETVAYPAISHPVPFPNECLFAGPFTRSTSSSALSDQMFQMEYWDRLGVKIFPQWFGTGNQSLVKPLIIAIGR